MKLFHPVCSIQLRSVHIAPKGRSHYARIPVSAHSVNGPFMCNACFVIPSICGYKRIRNRFRWNAEDSPQNIRGRTDILLQCSAMKTPPPISSQRSERVDRSIFVSVGGGVLRARRCWFAMSRHSTTHAMQRSWSGRKLHYRSQWSVASLTLCAGLCVCPSALWRENGLSLELRRLRSDLALVYKVLFGIVHINSDALFTHHC